MRGSIIKRGKKYSIVLDVGLDENGKRKRKWFSGYNSKKEAEKDISRLLTNFYDGELIDRNTTLFSNFLKEWIENKNLIDPLSPTTLDGYNNIIYNHLIPSLGNIQIQNLKPLMLQHYFDNKSKSLSRTTLSNHKRLLTSALIYAVDMELINKNPMNKIRLPKSSKKTIHSYLDIEESKKLIDLVNGHHIFEPAISLALLLGLRRGEVLGLKWNCVDFKDNIISIEETLEYVQGKFYINPPKTTSSKRKISVPKSLMSVLKKHKTWQNKMHLESGGAWINKNNLVCCNPKNGGFIRPQGLSQSFKYLLNKLNAQNPELKLPLIRFHDLRHTNASLMLAAGIDAKVAQNRLGHSSISITLDLYTHVLKDIDLKAASTIETLMSSKS